MTTLPDATATEWIAYEDEGEEITVAEDISNYPSDSTRGDRARNKRAFRPAGLESAHAAVSE